MSETNEVIVSVEFPESKKPKVPNWAMRPFEQFLTYIRELDEVLELSIQGISVLQAVPQIVRAVALAEADPDKKDDVEKTRKEFELASRGAELARREVDRGFPILHAQALVSLWGVLESTMHAFYAIWLANEPKAMQASQVQKLKVPLAEYESLDKADRPFYIAELLEEDIHARFKQGVSRFEMMLDIYGLGGPVEDTIRKNIYEMSQIRNVVIHRRAIADKKLVEACPWLGLKIGDPVIITRDMYRRYSETIVRYVFELIVRLAVYFGWDRDEFTRGLDIKKAVILKEE